MASKRICAVENCDKPAHRHGLCSSHSKRLMRTGSVEGKNAFFGTHLQWIKDHLNHEGDDCLTWPFQLTDSGRGRIWFRGRPYTADTVMCILKYGERPSRRHECAHFCGLGHLGCVNPRHLRWATLEENKADMVEHGTAPRGERHPRAKLTADDIRIIRSLKGLLPNKDVADMYGLHPKSISNIQTMRSWAWLE